MLPVPDLEIPLGAVLAFGLLTLAIASLWLPERFRPSSRRWIPWAPIFLLALGAAALHGIVGPLGIAALALLAILAWSVRRERLPRPARGLLYATLLVLAAALAAHQVPGFDNPRVLSDVVLSPDAIPYSKYLNFDKAATGLLLLALGHPLITRRGEWRRTLVATAPVVALTAAGLLALSFVLGYVELEFSVPPYLAFWAWTNLFFTCVAEEAIFRGEIQRSLERAFAGLRRGRLLALAVAAALFGIAHAAGGPAYVLLSTFAGLGYGWAYQRTGRIEASIATHCVVNLLHYLWFTYPALAGGGTRGAGLL